MAAPAPQHRIEADYLLETPDDPQRTAETIAGEQSSGTFVRVPGETAELRERSAARVVRLEVLEEFTGTRSLPSVRPTPTSERLARARLTLSWPVSVVGASLPNLMATVAGNLFELQLLSGLRILDIRLPEAFADAYPGPQFGVEGTRRLAGVHGRPLIGTIVKPSVGFSPEETAALVAKLCDAGIDFIKDDELQADPPDCPFDDRVAAVMREINASADRTGQEGDVRLQHHRRRRADEAAPRRAAAARRHLRDGEPQLRRPGRRDRARPGSRSCRSTATATAGATCRAIRCSAGRTSPGRRSGASPAWTTCTSTASPTSSASPTTASSSRPGPACTPMFESKPCTVMPVFSSGQTVRQAPATYAALGSPDLSVTAGGGILAHPDGPGAGVSALRQAWEAAVQGVPLADYARTHPALQAALGSTADATK